MVKSNDNVSHNYPNYLTDEAAIVKDGSAEKIFFPINGTEILEVIRSATVTKTPITISGGGTGLSGGRVPYSGWILATDNIRAIENPNAEKWTDPETKFEYEVMIEILNDLNAILTVPSGMTIKAVQNYVKENGWFYPPDPTERSAFVGGTINTNASGARSFKFGSTRKWVKRIRIVLMNGQTIVLDREDVDGSITPISIIITTETERIVVPRPTYMIPKTPKNVAGPVITDNSHPIDLFIGSGGLFGITTEITLKLIKTPQEIISIFIFCNNIETAYEIIKRGQYNRRHKLFPTPMALEFLGPRPIAIMNSVDNTISKENRSLIILEQDAIGPSQLDDAISYWSQLFDELGIEDTRVAQTHQEIEHFKRLRHLVPETINLMVKGFGQSKIGTDFAVPEEYLIEYFNLAFEIGNKFEEYQNDLQPLNDNPGYAIWAHAGDVHMHLNLIPRNEVESKRGKEMVLDLIKQTTKWGGSIAAEHGLGKKFFGGKPALFYQIGMEGIEEIKNIKAVLDPLNLLNKGNLLG